MTTMLQTLEETAAAYTSETRSIDGNGNCRYFNDGRCCAVGRCLEDPKRFATNRGTACLFNSTLGLETHLKPEYHGYPVVFWMVLQDLHDTEANWDENGLSNIGKREVNAIKKEFKL